MFDTFNNEEDFVTEQNSASRRSTRRSSQMPKLENIERPKYSNTVDIKSPKEPKQSNEINEEIDDDLFEDADELVDSKPKLEKGKILPKQKEGLNMTINKQPKPLPVLTPITPVQK